MSGKIRTIKDIRDKADNEEGGISGDPVGNLVAKYPTSPIINVLPTEDADAIMTERTGEAMMFPW